MFVLVLHALVADPLRILSQLFTREQFSSHDRGSGYMSCSQFPRHELRCFLPVGLPVIVAGGPTALLEVSGDRNEACPDQGASNNLVWGVIDHSSCTTLMLVSAYA